MRDITERIYQATVRDGDEKHVFYYRRPTNKEITAYQGSLFEKVRNKIIPKAAETRTKFGARIITGFEKGTLGAFGKVFSSDPADTDDYRADWKELLVEHVPDIVAAVGQHAFESTAVISGEALEIGDDLDGEDELDPRKSESPSTSPKQ